MLKQQVKQEKQHQQQYRQLQRRIFQRIEQHLLPEQSLIQSQNTLLEECRQRLERRKAFDSLNGFSLNTTYLSTIQHVSSTDDSFRNRLTEEVENSILNAALKQVKSCCSEQTFETVMTHVLNSKGKEYEDLRRDFDKKQKEIDQLSVLIIIKQKDIHSLERELADLRVREEFLQDERRKIKKKAAVLDQKEKRLHNAQMSLIFKQKLNQEGKRRYQRQKDIHQAVLVRLDQVHTQLDSIWQQMLMKMQTQGVCEGGCWRQQILRKCKQQLREQRTLLKQEQQQMQKEYDTMRQLSDQIRRVCVSVQMELPAKRNDDSTH